MRLQSIGTHDGSFHADEVTSCALLVVYGLADLNKIIRTRNPEQLNSCEYVCDVGKIYDQNRKRFDHHQNEYTGNLSSAGMVLRYLHDINIVSDGEFFLLANSLVDGVDAHDNGVDQHIPGVATFSHIIGNFLPIEYGVSDEEMNNAFYQALHFVIGHIQRLIDRYRYTQSVKSIVEDAMSSNSPLLVFDNPLPWIDPFFELGGVTHPALFVIMPAGPHWKLRTIPPTDMNKMQMRKTLPRSWAGLQDEELQASSGISGAIFCHKSLFISIWKTKEDAIAAAQIALRQV